MNGQDRDEIKDLKTEVKGLALNFDELSKATKADINDLYACYNDISESVDDIKTNHLHAIQRTLDLEDKKSPLYMTLESINKSIMTNRRIVGWGIAGLALLVGIIALCR